MKIEKGNPPHDGLYIGYMAYLAQPGNYFPMVLVYVADKGWSYHLSGQKPGLDVVGWIGPVPAWDDMHSARDADWLRDAGAKPAPPVYDL